MTRASGRFKKIDHVEIVTEHPERSFEFYTAVIGFEEKLRQTVPLPGGALRIVYLGLGGTGIELMTYEGVPVEGAPGTPHRGYALMALEVDDMAATLAELKTKGIAPSWGPRTLEQYARAEILDPDGNSIELREWKQRP
jgi:catechol 2,3-dioxygenase-like lactoylglutathione lyase family enzyme